MAVTFVGAATAINSNTAVGVLTVNYTATAGNTLIVAVGMATTLNTVPSMCCDNGVNGGSIYSLQNGSHDTGENINMFATAPNGIVSGVTQITVAVPIGAKFVVCVAEYSGVNSFGGAGVAAPGATTTPNMGVTQLDANDRVVGAIASNGVGTFSTPVGNNRTSGITSGGAAGTNVGTILMDISNGATTDTGAFFGITTSVSQQVSLCGIELKGASFTASGYFVQGSTSDNRTANDTDTTPRICLSKIPVAGNLLVLGVHYSLLGATSTVTDLAANVWTQAALQENGDAFTLFWAVSNGQPIARISFNCSGSPGATQLLVAEYAIGVIDRVVKSFGTSTGPADTGPSQSTNFMNEMLITFCGTNTPTTVVSVGTNFTNRISDANLTYNILQDRVVSSFGNYHGTATLNQSDGWSIILASFELSRDVIKERMALQLS